MARSSHRNVADRIDRFPRSPRGICASSSNRNFEGRQRSPTGRTLLMSPAMVAAAALAGEVVDVRKMLQREEVHA